MDEKFTSLKNLLIKLSSDPKFIHNKWFIEWHLNIVEQISLELCDIYKDADRDIVLGLVWMHDYAKVIDFDNEHNPDTIAKGASVLEEIGFDKTFIDKLMNYIEIFESKMSNDLSTAPIEVKIVSSADAASHMVGPFFPLHWYENSNLSVEELMQRNRAKLAKDWDRKIVLPEVKKAFQARHDFLNEMFGGLPNKFF
ncbi:MAG: hypothetical protein ABI721_01970 [Candidatus Dojkabacteria bacterium]